MQRRHRGLVRHKELVRRRHTGLVRRKGLVLHKEPVPRRHKEPVPRRHKEPVPRRHKGLVRHKEVVRRRHKGLVSHKPQVRARPKVQARPQVRARRPRQVARNTPQQQRLQQRQLQPRGGIRADGLLRLTPATLVAVRGRPTLASAVSRENSVPFVGDQLLNETGTAAQARAALTEANRLSFFMVSHRWVGQTN